VLPAGTIANDFYLSPGLGAGSAAAQANQGALNVNSTATLSGTIHLSGAPVPAGPGDRIAVTIATGGTLTISGKITGTGTLDIAAAHSDYCQIGNTANDWSGGLVIGQIASGGNANCYFRLGTSSTSAGPLPHGSGKGDVRLNGPSAASARFDLNGHNVTMNGLNSKGTYPANELVGTYQGGSGTLTLGDGDAAGTFNGMMTDHNISPGFSDVFTLVKIGAGTQTLSPGASASLTYHGSTTVNAGTLALSGANGWPANSGGYFTVASPAILDVTGLTTPATVGVGQTTKWLGTVNGPVVAQGGTICCIGTVNGATAVNAGGVLSPIDHKAGGPLGTMTQHGTMTFAGGGQYAWYINNADHATGTAGTDNGWSWVNNTGGLNITANSSSPFAIKITSFTALDVAGNASSWPILTSDTVITTFDPTAFTLDTSAFANPMGSGTFSIQLSGDSKSLLLSFAVPPAITAINVNTAGNTVAISGTNGPPNVTYRVLASTDVTAHLNTWSQVGTGTFANDGSFTFNGAINPAGSQRFYAIVLP
jgi:autotransporter-associated beta strand protein